MPDKLILVTHANPDCIASDGMVFIEIDGIRKQLKRVKSMVVRADDQGNIEADLTVYLANSSTEVVITRANAEAILAVEYARQLSFISDAEAKTLREWLDGNKYQGSEPAMVHIIDKLITELDRREQP